MPRAGLLCVVRHAHRPLRREQQRRLPLHFEVPCDEVGGLARAPRTSHLALATFAHASRLNAARARRTLHATHPTPHAARRTPHAARRTPHAACRTPLLALWQIVLEERCLGQTTCMFVVNDDLFGGDPCVGKQKRYAACHPWHSTLGITLAFSTLVTALSSRTACALHVCMLGYACTMCTACAGWVRGWHAAIISRRRWRPRRPRARGAPFGHPQRTRTLINVTDNY